MESHYILVVEDEPLVLDMIQDLLIFCGFRVLPARSGAEALAVINQRPALSALVTDIRLGDGPDGWDVAEAFRAVYLAAPVVYVSGFVPGHARKVPGSVFFDKPYSPTVIAAAIRTLIDQHFPVHS